MVGATRLAVRTCQKIVRVADKIAAALGDVSIRPICRLGSNHEAVAGICRSPPRRRFVLGLVMFDEALPSNDIVEFVENVRLDRLSVYDLDVEHTHNFIANGIVTHNSDLRLSRS